MRYGKHFIMEVALVAVIAAIAGSTASAIPKTRFVPAPGSPFPVGPMAGEPAVGDCNEDGNLDIVLACGTCCGSPSRPDSGHVQILLGDGRGGFRPAPGSPIPIGPSARKIAVGDVNRDRHLDVLVAQHDSYDVVILLGDGRGRFNAASTSPLQAGNGPRPHTHDITLGDVNSDGILDVLTTNANDNTISILLGDGAARFTPAVASPVPAGRHPYDVVALHDVNSDGKPDLITPNLRGNAVTVMLGNGKGLFTPAAGSPFPLGPRPGYVAVGDINGDSKPDIVATHDDDPLIAVLLGDGKGGFQPAPGSPVRPPNPVWGLVISDVNYDTKNDLVLGAQLDHGVTVMLGDGGGGFSVDAGSPLPAGKRANYVAVADLNKDGRGDIVAASYGSGEVAVFLNTPFSTFVAEESWRGRIAVGHLAPDFRFQTLDGRRMKLSDFRGKVVMLDFMATWCGACVASQRLVSNIYDQFERSRVEIVAISLDGGETTDTTRRDLERFVTEHRIRWPVSFEDSGTESLIANKYGITSLPVHIIVDQSQIIRWIGRGQDSTELIQAPEVIAQLVASRQDGSR